MRLVPFDPETLQGADLDWWNKWCARADAARTACLEAYAANKLPYDLDSSIWKDLKEFVLKCAFNSRCGYCESPMLTVTHGDADHFRPKKKVTVKVDGKAQEVTCEAGKAHPGYYWLAYDWENLIPACERCNRSGAKMNQFPVRKKHHCSPDLDSAELDEAEEPLLLNPHRESSAGVLRFGDQGVVASIESDDHDRGQASIDVYRLDREDLATERFRAQKQAWMEWALALGSRNQQQTDEVVEKWTSGVEPYSRAALDYIDLMWNEFKPRLTH